VTGVQTCALPISHNPACSNSRGALKLIRDAGFEPVVIDYLGSPPDVATLRQVLAESGLAATGLVRSKVPEFAALGLQGSDDDALLALCSLLNVEVRLGSDPF
jgi:arsenate reductase